MLQASVKAKVFSLIAAYMYSLCRCELTPLHRYVFRIRRMSLRFAGHGCVLEGRRVFLRSYGEANGPGASCWCMPAVHNAVMLLEDSTMCRTVNGNT